MSVKIANEQAIFRDKQIKESPDQPLFRLHGFSTPECEELRQIFHSRLSTTSQDALPGEAYLHPVFSETQLKSSISSLSVSWNLAVGNEGPYHPIKTPLKKLIKHIVHWLYMPALAQQAENNLKIVRSLNELSQAVLPLSRNYFHMAGSAPSANIILSPTSFRPDGSLDKFIFMHRWIQLYLNPSIQSIVITRGNDDGLYRDYIFSIIDELRIKNISFFHEPPLESFLEYLNTAGLLLSLDNDGEWLSVFPELLGIRHLPFMVASYDFFEQASGKTLLFDRTRLEEPAIMADIILRSGGGESSPTKF